MQVGQYQVDTWLRCAFMKAAFWWLSLVASGMWPFSFVFAERLVAQHCSHWWILALMELPRWLNICIDMGVPSFGCAVCFNPWYKNLSWAYALMRINLHAVGWLSSFFHSFELRIASGLTGNPFCCLQYSAGLLYVVSWPNLQLW